MSIAGCILAGGAGARMGGQDKGLVLWRGRPLIESVMERFSPQVDMLVISANRHLNQYTHYGHPVLTDVETGFPGPLGGMERALHHIHLTPHEWLAVVPCDAPLLPLHLVSHLHAALKGVHADVAYARTPDGDQPVFCLLHRVLWSSLQAFLEGGGRKVQHWFDACSAVPVPFMEDRDAFFNINTPDALLAHSPE